MAKAAGTSSTETTCKKCANLFQEAKMILLKLKNKRHNNLRAFFLQSTSKEEHSCHVRARLNFPQVFIEEWPELGSN